MTTSRCIFFFSSRRRHTRCLSDWSSDVCSSDLIYNQSAWEYSIIKLNQLGYFEPIDKDKDADFRTNEEEATVDLNLKVSERGRQQISFNGGLSGIGGSFFGLEDSTHNLFGRGEILSLNMSAGNRQK